LADKAYNKRIEKFNNSRFMNEEDQIDSDYVVEEKIVKTRTRKGFKG
jgi:hypothetical protein